jgi:hypothetical protein
MICCVGGCIGEPGCLALQANRHLRDRTVFVNDFGSSAIQILATELAVIVLQLSHLTLVEVHG